MKIVLTSQILQSALEFPRICVTYFWEWHLEEMFANEIIRDNSDFHVDIPKVTCCFLRFFMKMNLFCLEKVNVFITLRGSQFSEKLKQDSISDP